MFTRIGKFLCALIAVGLLGCTESGPKAALDNLAQALENKNPSMFLSKINMQAYAGNYIKEITSSDLALNSLNELGNFLGLGTVDNLIDSVVDVQARIRNEFEAGVASGELVAQCRTATSPDCPWFPQSLRNAQIVELGPNAAVAKVTTPAQITSWLALCKYGDNWQIVGRAVLEKNAKDLAMAAASTASPTPASENRKAVEI